MAIPLAVRTLELPSDPICRPPLRLRHLAGIVGSAVQVFSICAVLALELVEGRMVILAKIVQRYLRAGVVGSTRAASQPSRLRLLEPALHRLCHRASTPDISLILRYSSKETIGITGRSTL